MTRSRDIERIVALFAANGHLAYAGEGVSQLEHALQTAWLAETDGASPALVTAALLHDVGHILDPPGGTPTERGLDDRHEIEAAVALRGLFDRRVIQPIR